MRGQSARYRDRKQAEPGRRSRGSSVSIRLCRAALIVWTLSSGAVLVEAQSTQTPESAEELVQLDLEALMNIEVTSVSRRAERLSNAAASIFVITAEEIRRSGATTLPEALRLAPNLHVAQVSSSGYAISARGFNNSAANKLLVLIDGRPVYTPLFSGVFWDAQDVTLEDIERIEIISGPGGTLWGVNAVNGVINVITRSARDTHGALVTTGFGNEETTAAIRYGQAVAGEGHYRLFGTVIHRGGTVTANGTEKDDGWQRSRAGVRADWARGKNEISLIGAVYKGNLGQPLPGTIAVSGVTLALDDIAIRGANLLLGWSQRRPNGSTIAVKAYYDRTERTVPPTFAETLTILDLQFLHALRPTRRHAVSWGGEYRYGMDRVVNSTYVAFLPARVNQSWAALFVQDEMKLHDRVRVIVGVRAEHNDYTGVELLPNGRLAWNVGPSHLLWAAASRAVRAPSRLDRDTFVPGSPPFLLAGGPTVRSETATVYELGYRGQLAAPITYSVTAFRALYDHLRTQEVAPSRTFVHFANGMEGTTTGIEMWTTYQASRILRLKGGFSGLSERLRLRPGSNDVTAVAAQEGRDPERIWRLGASLDGPGRMAVDAAVRHVSALARPAVPGYHAVDLRIGWKARPDLELSVTAQNVLGNGHGEFAERSTRTELGRTVFVKVVGRFGDALH